MLALILFCALVSIASAQDESFSDESFNKEIDRAIAPDYLHQKRQLAVQKQGDRINKAILQFNVKELKHLRKEHGGFKLISWPSEKWLIDKNIVQIYQEDKI